MEQPGYCARRIPEKIIYESDYNVYLFKIIDIGPWPNVYIANRNGFETAEDFNGLDHGDIITRPCTYVGPHFSYLGDYRSWLGFSFSHCNDWSGYYSETEDKELAARVKKWTTEEIIEFAHTVIDFLSQFINVEYKHSHNVLHQAAILCPLRQRNELICKDCWRYSTYMCNHIRDAVNLDAHGYGDISVKLTLLKSKLLEKKYHYQQLILLAKTSKEAGLLTAASTELTGVIEEIDKLLTTDDK